MLFRRTVIVNFYPDMNRGDGFLPELLIGIGVSTPQALAPLPESIRANFCRNPTVVFSAKDQAEKARLKLPERERRSVAVGVIRIER